MYAMDKHEPRPSFTISQKPIDLTQSDGDEDDLLLRDRRRLPNTIRKPQANGGLPGPFQFGGIRTLPSKGDAFNTHSRSNHNIIGPNTSIPSIKRSRIVPSPAAKDQFRVGSVSSLRPTVPSMPNSSTGFSIPSPAAKGKKDMGRNLVPAAYAAVMNPEHRRKRRRTHDFKEMAAPKPGGLSDLDAAGQGSRQYSWPKHSNSSNASQSPMKSVPGISLHGPERRSSSVFIDSTVTKTKQPILTDAEKEMSVRKALLTQICPRIRTAVSQHFPNMDRHGREAIEIEVTQVIATHPTFLENLGTNGWKLSAEYENHVSLWAGTLAKQYADTTVILEPRQMHEKSIESRPTRTPMSSRPSGIARAGVYHISRERLRRRDFDSDSSTAPSDLKDVSEEELVVHSGAPKRFYGSRSSSPPTSINAVSIDGPNSNEIDYSEDYEGYKLSIPSARKASSVKGIATRDDIATQEILGLRLAALDSNTPRPYISRSVRDDIRRGLEIACNRRNVLSANTRNKLEGHVLHIDFCVEEIEYLITRIRPNHENTHKANPLSEIISLLQNQSTHIPRIIRDVMESLKMPSPNLAAKLLIKRGKSAITTFLEDAAAGIIMVQPQLLRLQSIPKQKMAPSQHSRSISSLLRERETWGRATTGISRSLRTFKTTLNTMVEDTFVRKGEWIDCCGDIFTISWTSDNAFICGATAHSDSHNMQYNKPGNLLVGSTSLGTLRAVPNHRIVRPVVTIGDNAENALQSMHRTQDPWLYTSVVSTSHSGSTGLTFTASFDKTVKVWAVKGDGSSSELRGTWEHKEKVNFVVSSDYHELVATASDVSNNAIRVYKIDKGDISKSVYDTYTGDRAYEQAQELQRSDKWAYFPATIQWGRLERIAHLLLVGYSPRSVTGDDNDIPEDKKNTGELCLWNVRDGSKVLISTARTQNVFEVIWHPTQPIFLAATSPCGTFEPETRTQIHVFGQNKHGTFLQIKSLDCPAFDINELTIMPSSNVHSYVTASCTDGNTYVWDTAFSDDPIHVLGHGESLDNPLHDLPQEVADTGVKFASWGRTSDRLYTGSSDGVLKAWDIRAPRGKAFVRNVLSVSGGISAGVFSRDYTKLLLGDATGKVHLLALDDTKLEYPVDLANSSSVASAQNGHQSTSRHLGQRPKPIIPHPEPEPPEAFDLQVEVSEQTAYEIANQFLESKQLILHPDRAIGAVQGPNYRETQFFRRECHVDSDWSQPILPEWQVQQQYEVHRQQAIGVNFPRLPEIKVSNPVLHSRNLSLDFDMARLDLASQQQLTNDRVDLDYKDDYSFNYELVNPQAKVFLNRVE